MDSKRYKVAKTRFSKFKKLLQISPLLKNTKEKETEVKEKFKK